MIDRPVEQDGVIIAKCDSRWHFQTIAEALLAKGELVGYVGEVKYPVPGE